MNEPVRILIVEDDETAAATVARVLERAGYEVRREASGSEATKTAASWQPACILVDRRLPDVDGLVVARRLRRAAKARVVVMSGDPPLDRDVRGIDAYLLKPVDVRVLLGAVAGSA